MTLLKKIIKEENESIKIHYTAGSFSSDTPPATINVVRSGIRMSINKLPQELNLMVDDIDQYRAKTAASKEIEPLMFKLFKVDRASHDELSKEVNNLLFGGDDFDVLVSELNDELEEIFAHLTTFLKSRLITLGHDVKTKEQARLKSSLASLKSQLEDKLGKQ